jgi:hypothetical protein
MEPVRWGGSRLILFCQSGQLFRVRLKPFHVFLQIGLVGLPFVSSDILRLLTF